MMLLMIVRSWPVAAPRLATILIHTGQSNSRGWWRFPPEYAGIASGSLDYVETNITQLFRTTPLETCEVEVGGAWCTTLINAETLRARAEMFLNQNTGRDYQDFVALTK